MMLLSQILGHPVISAEDARPAGAVAGLGIDPATCRVTELYLRDAKQSGDSVPWAQVRGVGPDAVIIDTAAAGDHGPSHSRARKKLLGKRILTEYGEDIGTLTDLTFDPETGGIGDLHIGHEQVPGSLLLGLGSYALVIGARGAATR
ncbi:PRC-barrel domain-containing protein [Streptomyces sp. NPDC048436]|uniref:PRC-barrel domain-containing protein n=1 Tax=Streptomyces sp. NPDC048436 TaxID=3365550 RepID=UPI00371FBF34